MKEVREDLEISFSAQASRSSEIVQPFIFNPKRKGLCFHTHEGYLVPGGICQFVSSNFL